MAVVAVPAAVLFLYCPVPTPRTGNCGERAVIGELRKGRQAFNED
jgi:hypothetical protein